MTHRTRVCVVLVAMLGTVGCVTRGEEARQSTVVAATPTLMIPSPTTVPATPTLIEATTVSAPTEETSVSGGRVSGDPKVLIVQITDLPQGFQNAAQEEQSSSEYSVVYLRPEAVTASVSSGASPLGVIVNVHILGDDGAAVEQLRTQGTMDSASIEADIRSTSPNVKDVEVQPVDVQLAGVDEVIAVQAYYTIEPTHLLDYRYRMRVGNALVNLIVTAQIAETNADVPEFRELAHQIAQKQTERLNQARR